ncbi:hypothetical protein FHETE_10142 [Fusarium heterosporum]|uniref:Uncharacterized protein n=1 Tax=Fusarium heterosporum TaxID=42747 RepID=A0A8H5WH64_FUSHE|nr:hypothetical protein FHETE_10142 [Fusarium heterosporum]
MTRLYSRTEEALSSDPNLGSHGTVSNTTMYPSIAEFFMKRDFEDDMQDALAIVWFPSLEVSSFADIEFLMQQVPTIMHHWAKRLIPDPYTGMGRICQATIDRLTDLHRRILLYIQDYMAKATSCFLPRAYSRLPNLKVGTTGFRDGQVEGSFDLSCLGTPGRKRIFWAFLRYELMSKIRLYKAVAHRYYAAPRELNMRGGHLLWPWESEALSCVQTYVSTLYEAFLARWERDEPLMALGMKFDSRTAFETMHHVDYWHPRRGHAEWGGAKFSDFGFGLVTELIKKKREYRILERLILTFIDNAKYADNSGEVHRRQYVRHPRISSPGDGCIPLLYWQIVAKQESYTIKGKGLEMYRQRAWPFFDDPKVHAQRSAFFPWFTTEPVVKSCLVLKP